MDPSLNIPFWDLHYPPIQDLVQAINHLDIFLTPLFTPSSNHASPLSSGTGFEIFREWIMSELISFADHSFSHLQCRKSDISLIECFNVHVIVCVKWSWLQCPIIWPKACLDVDIEVFFLMLLTFTIYR